MAARRKDHLKSGTLLDDRYIIGDVLGEGGFGITYAARNSHNDTRVAVKEFYCREYMHRDTDESSDVHLLSGDDESRFTEEKTRFLKEARTLRDFADLPGIVGVLDYFEENATAYIVMELLEGETLKRRIDAGGRMDAEDILRKIPTLLKALSAVHTAGVVHRDISPDNIMLGMDGSLTLMDFGAARNYAASPVTHSLIYKDGFAAKEQLDKKGKLGPWTDLYSLCATIYFCVTGHAPEDAFQRILHDELKKPSELGIAIDPTAESLIMKGLSLRPEMRWQSAEDMLAEIMRIYPEKDPAKEAARRKKRRRILTAVTTAVAALAAAFFCFYKTHEAEIRLRNIPTETVYLMRQDLAETDYRESAAIIKARVEEFAGKKNYLWKVDDEKISFTVPEELFDSFDPGNMVRCFLSRTAKAGFLVEGEEKHTELKPEYIESATPMYGENELIKGDVYDLPDGPLHYVRLVLTPAFAKSYAKVLEKRGGLVQIMFDYDNDSLGNHFYFNGYALGDGQTVDLCATDFNEVCARMLSYDLTHEHTNVVYAVSEDWIVRWENPGDSLFPGKYQVRADAMKGDTIMLRYNLDTESKAGVFSTMYVIKQRLDALSGEYAFGLSKDDETEIVVQIKREFASHFLAETLAYSHYCYIKTDTREDVLFVNDNEILDYRSVMNANDGVSKLRRPTLEIEEDGSGGWKLRVNIHTMRLEECRNTLADCQKKGIERIYYCCEGGSYPILSASVDDALHTIEDYYFLFDTIEIGKNLPLDPSTRTLGEYLITYLTEDPQETATADNVIRAESADGSRDFSVSYVTDLPYSRDEHLEEEYAAITEDPRKADSSYYDNRHRKEADISFTNNGTGISVRLYDVPGDGFPLNALAEVKDLIHENGLDNGHYSLRFSFTPENAREDELYRSISFYISNGAFVYDVSSYSFTEEEWPNVADYLASNPWYSIRKATYSD